MIVCCSQGLKMIFHTTPPPLITTYDPHGKSGIFTPPNNNDNNNENGKRENKRMFHT